MGGLLIGAVAGAVGKDCVPRMGRGQRRVARNMSAVVGSPDTLMTAAIDPCCVALRPVDSAHVSCM